MSDGCRYDHDDDPDLDEALARKGTIRADYRHHQRMARSTQPLILNECVLRWNEVYLEAAPISTELDRRARSCVAEAFTTGAVPVGEGLGFVVLHHSTASDYLLIGVWYQTQEMWEVLFVRDDDGDGDFRQVRTGEESSTMCVWEMAAVWHERELWTRYLFSAREIDDRRAWATDSWEAMV